MNDDGGLAWVERNWWLLSARGDIPRPGDGVPARPERPHPGGHDGPVVWVPPRWWARWRDRRACFHHDHRTGTSWIGERLIEMGSRKMFWCRKCQRTWFT